MKKRRVQFGCGGHDSVFSVPVVVTGSPRGGDTPEISPEQHARYRDLERSNGGAVPLTEDEFDALEAGDAGRLAALASSPGSTLHPLLSWAQRGQSAANAG
jgi:hypothetical protein